MQRQENNVYYAGFFVRLAAFVLDWVLVGILLLVIKLPLLAATLGTVDGALFTKVLFQFTIWDILLYILAKGYFVTMTYCTGATFGKKLMNLKVVSAEEKKLTLWDVIYRETIGKYLSDLFLWIGFIIVGVDKEKRGFHDMLSDTRVIYNLNNTSKTLLYDVEEQNDNKSKIDSVTLTKPAERENLERYYRRNTETYEKFDNEIDSSKEKPQYDAASYGYNSQNQEDTIEKTNDFKDSEQRLENEDKSKEQEDNDNIPD